MSVVGTPCYISPEVCEHSPYNQKSDIWAVGCILYELMTLKRAFEARNLPALVTKIMRADYQPPSPKYSSQLRYVFIKRNFFNININICGINISYTMPHRLSNLSYDRFEESIQILHAS